MAVKPGDVIDEAQKSLNSCRLVARVVEGGAGFSHINCCGLELTADQVTETVDQSIERFQGENLKPVVTIDESKNHPNSCGLKLEIVDGGGGFKNIVCCGNELTAERDAV